MWSAQSLLELVKLLSAAVVKEQLQEYFKCPWCRLAQQRGRKAQGKPGDLCASRGAQQWECTCAMEENPSTKGTQSRLYDVCGFIHFFLIYNFLWLYYSKKFDFHAQLCICTFIFVFFLLKGPRQISGSTKHGSTPGYS